MSSTIIIMGVLWMILGLTCCQFPLNQTKIESSGKANKQTKTKKTYGRAHFNVGIHLYHTHVRKLSSSDAELAGRRKMNLTLVYACAVLHQQCPIDEENFSTRCWGGLISMVSRIFYRISWCVVCSHCPTFDVRGKGPAVTSTNQLQPGM